jgi:hypothetical protein
MGIFRHCQTSLAMSTYSHVVRQLQDQAAVLMDDLLWV